MNYLIDKLQQEHFLSKEEFLFLLQNFDNKTSEYLFAKSRTTSQKYFGNKIFIRGLIEFTNFCKNDCYYCGIRSSNKLSERYRLSKEEILSCCESGYKLGFRTFVLQGGEDNYFTDELLVDIVKAIRTKYTDCAITLSCGEKSFDSYKKLYQAGANRYLLRHETAVCEHYAKLHPAKLTLANRKKCLYDLKQIGYQVGTGFMVGSPYQTAQNIVEDLLFIKQLQPSMIGIGPFIPHKHTPLKDFPAGNIDLVLFLLGILRLMIPNVLLPATTALGTLQKQGREKGILAGANVVMPNLSPTIVRKKYSLYDGKISTNEEAAEGKALLEKQIQAIGYQTTIDRGDFINLSN